MRSSRQAFTIIEVMIVVAVMALLAVVGTTSLFSARGDADLTSTANQIYTLLRQAQSSSATQKDGVAWGVRFSNPSSGRPSFALFSNSYSTSSVTTYRTLPNDVAFVTSTLAVGSTTDVMFAQVSGATTAKVLKIYLTSNPTHISTITISASGAISKTAPALAAPQLVQYSQGTNDLVNSVSSTLPGAVTSGNLLVVMAGGWISGDANNYTFDVSDTQGNSFVLAQTRTASSAVGSSQRTALYYAKNVTGGADTVTLSYHTNCASCDLDLIVAEYSGLSASTPFDQSSTFYCIDLSVGCNSVGTGNITTLSANEALVSYAYDHHSVHTWTASGGYTVVTSTANPGSESLVFANRIVSATATYSNTLSFIGTGAPAMTAGITSFQQ